MLNNRQAIVSTLILSVEENKKAAKKAKKRKQQVDEEDLEDARNKKRPRSDAESSSVAVIQGSKVIRRFVKFAILLYNCVQ